AHTKLELERPTRATARWRLESPAPQLSRGGSSWGGASSNAIDRWWRVWYHCHTLSRGFYLYAFFQHRREPMTLVASECRPIIAAVLERAAVGAHVSAPEAYAFEHTTSSELVALLQVADALRARHHGNVITYSRKVFLPLTNLCRDYCGYCTFRKDP